MELKLNMQIKLKTNKVTTNKSYGIASFSHRKSIKPTALLALHNPKFEKLEKSLTTLKTQIKNLEERVNRIEMRLDDYD